MNIWPQVKKIVTVTALAMVSFSLVAMLSTWWVGNHVGGQHECLAAAAQGVDCPTRMDPVSLRMHISIFGDILLTSSILFLLLATIARLITFGRPAVDHQADGVGHRRLEDEADYGPPKFPALQRWLARLQLSPTLV